MNAVAISRRLRDHRFTTVAEFAVKHGYAVGMPDETGRPRILASVRPVTRCSDCGQAMPGAHPHTNPSEVTNG
jgi:hypothetical protein